MLALVVTKWLLSPTMAECKPRYLCSRSLQGLDAHVEERFSGSTGRSKVEKPRWNKAFRIFQARMTLQARVKLLLRQINFFYSLKIAERAYLR